MPGTQEIMLSQAKNFLYIWCLRSIQYLPDTGPMLCPDNKCDNIGKTSNWKLVYQGFRRWVYHGLLWMHRDENTGYGVSIGKKVFFRPASCYNFDCSACRLHVQRSFCDRRYTTRFPQIKQKKYFRVICRIFIDSSCTKFWTVLSSTHMFKSSVMTYSNRSVLRNFRRERLNVNYFLTFKFSKNHYL